MSERPKVLVVDDVEANLVVIEGLLTKVDCEVVRASSGNAALRHLLKDDFAAILLDVQMPEMDGFEVARLARMSPRSRNVPIIFVTAMLETEETLSLGYDSGAVDVLFKPLNAHVLRSKVQVFLELYRGRRELAEEIEAHKRTLSDLDAFNYSVSHDLRAPLRPIKGFAEAVLEDHGEALGEEARRYLTAIVQSASRMDQLITDLLRLSTVSRSQLSAHEVDVSAIAKIVSSDLQRSDPERSVELVVAPHLTAYGDSGLIRIALENLLRNAWKFTGPSKEPRIEVGSETLDGETVYYVRDNGVGFDPTQQSKLFRAFARLHSTAEFQGTGIGLAIVQRVIERHGGRIWAKGEVGSGATFYFTLASKRDAS